jgi:hypothetical protein
MFDLVPIFSFLRKKQKTKLIEKERFSRELRLLQYEQTFVSLKEKIEKKIKNLIVLFKIQKVNQTRK